MSSSSKVSDIAAIAQDFSIEKILEGDHDEVVQRIAGDHNVLSRLLEEHQIFKEAIEQSPVAYCVFDAEDRLIAFNSSYSKLHPHTISTDGRRKVRLQYAELVREELKGQFSGEELEAEISRRVKNQRLADGTPVTREYADLGYYRVIKYPLTSGATAGLAFDVSEIKQQEIELMLAKANAEEASERAQQSLNHERQRKQEARLLSELGEWMQSCKSLTELYQVIGRFMSEMFPSSSGELYIYSNSRDSLDGVCSWRDGDKFVPHFQVDDCWALRRGRLYTYGSGLVNFPCGHAHDLEKDGEQSSSYLCLPIHAHGDTVGLLHIRNTTKVAKIVDGLSVEDAHEFAIQCSEQISLAIANVRLRDELRDQSTRDSLTGLYNRRHFFERCRTAISNAVRSGESLGIISLDADFFKRINDNLGHEAGDEVLRRLGDVMSSLFSGANVAARLGGEEFSVLLPGCSWKDTEIIAEDLRKKIEDLQVNFAGSEIPRVTISAGFTAYPEGGTTTQELLRAADAALYSAKNAGRNTIRSSIAE